VEISRLFLEFSFLCRVFSHEVVHKVDFSLQNAFDEIVQRLSEIGILRKFESQISIVFQQSISANFQSPDSSSLPFAALYYCNYLWSFIDSYWVTCVVLIQALDSSKGKNRSEQQSAKEFHTKISRQVITERCQWYALNLISQGKCLHAESASKETFGNAITVFKQMGVISEDGNGISLPVEIKEENIFTLEARLNLLRRNPAGSDHRTGTAKL